MKHTRPPGWIHSVGSPGDDDRNLRRIGPHVQGCSDAGGGPRRVKSPTAFSPLSETESHRSGQAPVGQTLTNLAGTLLGVLLRPCRVFVIVGLITFLFTLLLTVLTHVSQTVSGWYLPGCLALLGLVAVGVFEFQRHQFQRGLDSSQPHRVINSGAGDEGFYGPPTDGLGGSEQLRNRAHQAGQTYARMSGEYRRRPKRFLPRVEAAQRALRAGVEPGFEAPWLAVNLRLWIASFLVVSLDVMICGVLNLVLLLDLLL